MRFRRCRLWAILFFIIIFGCFSIVYSDEVVYEYDDWGRLTRMTYDDSRYYKTTRTLYDYDDIGNVTSQVIDGNIMTDSDGDGMPDDWEADHGLNPYASSDKYGDPEGDGLNNFSEYVHGTNPASGDTDGDGYSEGYEIPRGADPLDRLSKPDPPEIPGLGWRGIGVLMFLLALLYRLFEKTQIEKNRLAFIISFGIVCSMGQALAEPQGPGWVYPEGRLVSPEEAQIYYESVDAVESGESVSFTGAESFEENDESMIPLGAATATNEIIDLARALESSPFRMYEYVKNHIDYTPYFGSLKGATLTYLDGAGNDFDQASLLIALLRHAGYTDTQYVYGRMWIRATGASDQKDMAHWLGVEPQNTVISSLLQRTGIPAVYESPYWKIDRVWVKLVISGTTYLLDPAFKIYGGSSGIDLKAAMGYSQNALLSSAGGTTGADYVQGLNETNLKTTLRTYTQALINTLKNSHANAGMDEIVGGREIVAEQLSPPLPANLPFTASPLYYWNDIPTAYTHTIQIRHGEIDKTLNISDLSGQKLTIRYLSGSTPKVAQLYLDDVQIASETAPVTGADLDSLHLIVKHKYPDNTDFDQTVTHALVRGSTYVIVYDFGGSRDGRLLEKRQRQLNAYRVSGYSDTSRQVVSETLNVFGKSWMRDTTLYNRLTAHIGNMIDINHHRFGVMAQESGYYIDVKSQVGAIVSRTGTQGSEAFMKTESLAKSGMEHGVLEQYQISRPAMSTVKILQLSNANNDRIFQATSANYATIKSQLINYSDAEKTHFQSLVNQGRTLILPKNGNVQLEEWAGAGYVDYKTTGTVWVLNMIISGGYNGGYVVTPQPAHVPTAVNYSNVQTLPKAWVPKYTSTDPVDMLSGHFLTNNTDLSLSGGKGGLSLSRSYNSGNHNMESVLGYGWSHVYDMHITEHAATAMGLGERTPLDAAPMIVNAVSTLDLMTGETTAKDWMTAALINKWAMDQIEKNGASIHRGSDVSTYVKMPNGNFSKPPGVNGKLVLSGGRYSVEERYGGLLLFNADKKIESVTDADGNTVSFSYNADKSLYRVSDDFNHSLTFSYTNGKISSVSDSAGRSVSYAYTDGDLIRFTDAEGKYWDYTYDTKHRIKTLENPLDITTVTNTYDLLGRVKYQVVPRQSGSATYQLYFSGYRNIEKDPSGYKTIYHYDRKGRLTASEDALWNKTTRLYDGQNHVTAQTDPLGNTSRFEYDKNNNRVKTIDPDLNETIYTYDSQFHLTDVSDPMDRSVAHEYDSEHHRIQTKMWPEPGRQVSTEAEYHGNGLIAASVDGRGIRTTYTWDSRGNPDTERTSTRPAIDYTYDVAGRMTSLRDPVGSTTNFFYDKRNLLKTRTDPLGKTATVTYYDDGRVYRQTDRKGHVTTYTYTASGKTESVTYHDDESVWFTYDTRDNLTDMMDSMGTTTYTYDGANRITSLTDPHGFTVSYAYDAAGNVTRLTYPGGKNVFYEYDSLNRLESVRIEWLSNDTAHYGYDASGNLLYMNHFNSSRTDYSYDDANRLVALENRVSWGGDSIACYFYTLDNNGNRVQVDQDAPITPDLLSRTDYFFYNAKKNRLLSGGGSSFTYDDEGQCVRNNSAVYVFDSAHRLESFPGSEFRYDGAGNRLQATRSGVITRYIYDAAGNLIAEADGDDVIQKYYIYGDGLIAMATPGNSLYCYHFDGTGNMVAMTDWRRVKINTCAYTPFGEIANEKETVVQPFKFCGRFGVMYEQGGYYMRARYYSPGLGRFISEDPIGFDGGDVNLYAYVQNNPIMLVDPLGLAVGDWWDFSANYGRAQEISVEERRNFAGHHNDVGDAMRHATWSKRTADETNVFTAWSAGIAHEVDNLVNDNSPWRETLMDLHNNKIGRQAGANSTQINQSDLRTNPQQTNGCYR